MHAGGQKMDCCKSKTEKDLNSDALPVRPENKNIQVLEFTGLSTAQPGLNNFFSGCTSEFKDYKTPRTSEPLYEKNQDLRI